MPFLFSESLFLFFSSVPFSFIIILMKRILDYTITNEYENFTIREFLTEKGYPKGLRAHLFRTEGVLFRNGEAGHSSDRLKASDKLKIILEESMPETYPAPENTPLSILYEDKDILVINKPAHMPVHPSMTHYEHTLANAVFYYLGSKKEAGPFRCINRLDKDTTGITVLAKHSLSGGILGRQMNERKIHRTYLAIVRGITPESGTITAPIGRKEGSVLERQVDFEHGEYACTHYRRLATKEMLSGNALSLIALRLDTGRTHQIRVHMSYLGYPLIGDFLYNPDFSLIKRQALHACQLEFEHPITKEQLCFTAPLPGDMQMLFPEFHVKNLNNIFSN